MSTPSGSDGLRQIDPVPAQPCDDSRMEGEPDRAALLTAIADEGTVLRVEEGVAVATTLHLVFVGAEDGSDRAWHLRNLIELRAGASLTLVEHHLEATAHANLANALGAWLGPAMLLPIVLGASVIGAIVGIGMKLAATLREGRYVPFGPFLAGGALVVMLAGSARVLGWMGWA